MASIINIIDNYIIKKKLLCNYSRYFGLVNMYHTIIIVI